MSEGGGRVRPASAADADDLARLVDIAGEGLPRYLWERMAAPGESAWDVGRARAARVEGSFSYRNATIAEVEGKIAACLVGYPLEDEPAPIDRAAMPAMFVPLQELENLAPGTWYVNVLAVYPEFQGQGIGSGLLTVAEARAREAGSRGLSIVVSDGNEGARRLYRRHGYGERAARPMVKEAWENPGENWLLLVK